MCPTRPLGVRGYGRGIATVLTWNLAGRVKATLDRQIDVVTARADDVVCLQELTPTTIPRWTAALTDAGYHVAISPYTVEPAGSRRLAVLIASRAPVQPLEHPAGIPWPERHLGIRTELDGSDVIVHTLHAPLSSKPDQAKVLTLEALHETLTNTDGPAIVTGDFNTPSYESREGEIQTFARTRSGKIRPAYGERHDAAELLLIDDLPKRHGWKDAFRELHGYSRRDRSYMFTGRKFGWRLDHIVVSEELEPVACEYVHDWREERLSDHSAMWAEVRVGTGDP